MAGDFDKPALTDLYTNVLTLIRENLAEVAKMMDASTAVNIPTGTKRWNATTKRFEKWTESAWAELLPKASDSYDIRVALSDDVQISSEVTAKGQGQIGANPTATGTDANTHQTAGRFFIANATAVTNWPETGVGGYLLVDVTSNGNYLRQIFTPVNAAKIYVRVSSNAGVSWTDWTDIGDFAHDHTLNSLSNVTISSIASGEILKWNGTAWINNTLAEAGIPLDAIPAGAVFYHAKSTAPTGFLKANGAAVSRTTYSALFTAIGTTFGAGDGSTTFNLPDLRGEFIRGWDDARGVDASRVFGSAQGNANLSHAHTASETTAGSHSHGGTAASNGAHTHTVSGTISSSSKFPTTDTSGYINGTATTNSTGAHTHTVTTDTFAAHSHTITVAASGGTEARPRNVALLAVIKY